MVTLFHVRHMRTMFHVRHMRTINLLGARLLAAVLAAFMSIFCAGPIAAQDSYHLGPGDQVALRFVYWDTIELGFAEFSALDGTYIISPDNALMMPVLGAVNVADKSLDEIAAEIAEGLRDRLGLLEPPGTSISIVSYRPVYVLGYVNQPGAYEYRPDLTVLQALALAGGLDSAVEDGMGIQGAAIRSASALREIAMDLARGQIRSARLRSEVDDSSDFALPEGLSHPDGAESLAAIADQERDLFRTRAESQTQRLDSIEARRILLETEIAALEEKNAALFRQVEMMRESVGDMESLLERGLARSPNLMSLQGQLINLEARQLDTETEIFRARQSIADLDRERIEVDAARRLNILSDLQSSEAELEQLDAQRDMNRRLLLSAGAALTESEILSDVRVEYRITRQGGEGSESVVVGPETRLAPADVLEVRAVVAQDGN